MGIKKRKFYADFESSKHGKKTHPKQVKVKKHHTALFGMNFIATFSTDSKVAKKILRFFQYPY
jgi:hypothetical protein